MEQEIQQKLIQATSDVIKNQDPKIVVHAINILTDTMSDKPKFISNFFYCPLCNHSMGTHSVINDDIEINSEIDSEDPNKINMKINTRLGPCAECECGQPQKYIMVTINCDAKGKIGNIT